GGGGGFGGPGFRIVRGGGISGILILVVMFFVLRAVGIDPMPILFGDGSMSPTVQTQGTGRTVAEGGTVANDETTQFARTVLAETEDVWSGIFQSRGQTYTPPTMVLFSDQVRSACGYASAASGPFYCPGDRKLYIDLSFYKELANRFGASGDFAQAYVLAHEVGHHVQNLLGILPKFNQMRQQMSEAQANQTSVRVELQADCLAGVWGHYTDQKGILEAGDLEEALNAAHQIGDDTLQRRSQGYVVPESFNHGTSAQRAKWFQRGFDSGQLGSCDTFSGDV
ncbi:KPN_02809 family neutral zinc metallopeptidase, partial [Brucella melitensis]|uniref:KPN_02809 family neutral zinc metallopeptidase n=1 Tax=Brucella melitensis TaxID=29459 RepID=UPI000367A86A